MRATSGSTLGWARRMSRTLIEHVRVSSGSTDGGDTLRFSGDYDRWNDALTHADGYDSAVILERTRDALLKVKHGDPRHERDSVLLDTASYSLPMIAGLLRSMLRHRSDVVKVVDFGGSLGTSYFQCSRFLGGDSMLQWAIVEQPSYVACGREHFQNERLRFYSAVEDALSDRPADTLLLSSVLQYLEEPYRALSRLLSHGLRDVVIDRTPFLASGRQRLTVQHVPSWIYPASYPAWFFAEDQFRAAVHEAGYRIVDDFAGSDDVSPDDSPAYFKGFICEAA